ncbi:hypothetical protein ACHAPC_005055 [Botrytis cinerea]|uniref:DMATS1, similar to dimethylallyl tryptophan synthase n=2 Tax=Botryotinia fuckeliana TaxID=40559 RepID=G2Y828_BOTF4|nr:putative dimethylallyl tryptophan synthase protein [Botrytis cinerea BcDW1]CCD48756.1 DMATS1, similar to dimethylallyl tryptophan synthase [Botrytis cinerea T4]
MDCISGIQRQSSSSAHDIELASSTLPDEHLSPDALLWWNATSEIVRDLLVSGKYDLCQQTSAMMFYHTYIVPNLGAFPMDANQPPQWKSYMTDDFSPIEFSWNWGNAQGDVDRRVRFSIEAINKESGTVTDPWNQKATIDLVDRLEADVPEINVQWFYRLLKDFTPPKDVLSEDFISRFDPQQPRSSLFMAFELRDKMPVVKLYMMPFARAVGTSQTESAVIFESLSSFAHEMKWSSLQGLVQSLNLKSRSLGLDPFMIAFDCLSPQKSRMKIYARCPDIRLASVMETMSIFDDKSKISDGLKELQMLWDLVFSCGGQSHTDCLPHKAHITSGILYYFEVRPGSSKVTTKVYLPVKHYAKDDLSVAEGLQEFFRKRRGMQDQSAGDFMGVLNRMCTYRRLEKATGLQTYISCKIENDSLEITSYLSPEMYNEGRWSRGNPTV